MDWLIEQRGWIWLAGFAVLALVLVLYLSWARRPRFRPCTVMTANEREFYQRILQACPDCEIWPQVPLLALVRPDARDGSRAFWAAFRQISNARVDWVIARNMDVLAIIELDDRSHDAKRDARRDDILKGCGYRVLRFQSKNRPNPQQIHDAVFTRR